MSGERRRVAIDARHLHSGIGRYIESLAAGLARAAPADLEPVLIGDPERLGPLVARTGFAARRATSRLYSVRAQLELPRRLRGIDLFHATHYPIPLAFRGPLVVTILDLHHLAGWRTPREVGRQLHARAMLAAVARQARVVVAISRAAAADIVARCPRLADRLRVIPLSPAPELAPVDDAARLAACRRALGLPQRFVLCLGNVRPHKNVDMLVRAYAAIAPSTAAELVVAGDGATSDSPPLRLAAALGVGDRVRALGVVPAPELPALLSLAELGACPSAMEGFGLVPLEMMACGLPVVASSIPAHREVLGEAARLVPVGDVAAWSRTLLAALERDADDGRRAWGARGRARAARYSREAAVAAHLDAYRAALV